MIRPYVAVLKDSFHEAFVSRVLWILLILATVVLLLLSGLSMQAKRAIKFSLVEGIADRSTLVMQLGAQDAAEAPSPGKHIMSLGSDDFRKLVKKYTGEKNPDDMDFFEQQILLEELNSILQKPNFYDEESFADVPQIEEVEELLKRGPEQLNRDELLYLNRQLLWSAYPLAVMPVPNEVMQITWFGNELGDPMPGSREMAETVVRLRLTGMLNLFVGNIGVFIAILVTASLIPQTFEAGAADLLLSKPVARPLLFLTKFFGGCAFIVLLSTYILAGVWLLLGIRFGMWETALLKVIPMFLYLFVIYYTVSAAAGLYWKNTIVAVSLSIVFWLALFVLNWGHLLYLTLGLSQQEITGIYPNADGLMTTNGAGQLTRWNGEEWQPIMQGGQSLPGSQFRNRTAYDPKTEELFYIQGTTRVGPLEIPNPSARLARAAVEKGQWQAAQGPLLPPATDALFLGPEGELLLVASSGVYRLNQLGRDKLARGEFKNALPVSVPGVVQQQPPQQSPFKQISPAGQLTLLPPFAAAMHPETGDLAVFSTDTLTLLERGENGDYQIGKQWTDEADKITPGELAWAGDTLLLAQYKGQVRLFDPATLEVRHTFTTVRKGMPVQAAASADGKWFAVLYHDQTLSVLDAAGEQPVKLDGDVSGFQFTDDGLLVADRQDRLTTYEPGSWQTSETVAPKLSWGRLLHKVLVVPLYTILPNPTQLDAVVLYLILKDDAAPGAGGELQAQIKEIDIWPPILIALAFIAVMLGLTCWYVHRMDI